MASIDEVLSGMQRNPAGVRFRDLCKICDHYFGKARISATSHQVYRIPWAGDPRVNIQNARGQAKAYQDRQVLWAIRRLESDGKDS